MRAARIHVGLGLLAITALSSLVVRIDQARRRSGAVQAATGIVLGTSVEVIDGVPHKVEHFTGAPGYFTLEEQLAALGVSLDSEDRWTAIPDPSLGIGSDIEIVRATPVTVYDGGTEQIMHTWTATVGALFNEQGIALGEHDRLDPAVDTLLTPDAVVTITRIGIQIVSETETIDSQTLTKDDPALEKGTTRLGQPGHAGERTKTYRVTYENGVETDRQLVSNEVTIAPIDEIVYRGTKVVMYGEGDATWYAWKPGGAANNFLPFGTKVHVVNLENGKSVDVVINDRGIQGSAVIDLDKASFAAIAPLGEGRVQVRLEKAYE